MHRILDHWRIRADAFFQEGDDHLMIRVFSFPLVQDFRRNILPDRCCVVKGPLPGLQQRQVMVQTVFLLMPAEKPFMFGDQLPVGKDPDLFGVCFDPNGFPNKTSRHRVTVSTEQDC